MAAKSKGRCVCRPHKLCYPAHIVLFLQNSSRSSHFYGTDRFLLHHPATPEWPKPRRSQIRPERSVQLSSIAFVFSHAPNFSETAGIVCREQQDGAQVRRCRKLKVSFVLRRRHSLPRSPCRYTPSMNHQRHFRHLADSDEVGARRIVLDYQRRSWCSVGRIVGVSELVLHKFMGYSPV